MYLRIAALTALFSTLSLFPCDTFKDTSLPPKDDSSKDKSFLEFKKKLTEAIRKKDKKFLLDSLDQDVRFTFGDDNGKKNFIQYYELDTKPNQYSVWNILDKALKFGAHFSEGRFVFPYFFKTMPPEFDPFTSYMVTGTNVNVRSGPNIDSSSIAKLSYQVVTIGEYNQDVKEDPKSPQCLWQKVCLADGSTGYICDQYLRSFLDYRVFFEEKGKKQWKITILVVGD